MPLPILNLRFLWPFIEFIESCQVDNFIIVTGGAPPSSTINFVNSIITIPSTSTSATEGPLNICLFSDIGVRTVTWTWGRCPARICQWWPDFQSSTLPKRIRCRPSGNSQRHNNLPETWGGEKSGSGRRDTAAVDFKRGDLVWEIVFRVKSNNKETTHNN